MATATNKFRLVFEHAPKSATHFDGESYSTFDNEREVYVISLNVPQHMLINELCCHNTPMSVIEEIAKMLES